MDPERTVHKQLIDQHREFNREAIESAAKIIGTANREYFSVAIIGVQNSGKSTLLNHLFGTNFSVLKDIAGTRTTRGIWISVDKSQNILVFDVEGNDSMDRAEEQDYEKMVATYALVTANVLIINVWSKTVGQYNGTQYETLKVIMDICITQFKQESPKTILFCVRDFNEQYDNEGETRRKIIKDVNDIWRKIEKPAELQMYNDKPEKFFTIEVSVLRRFKEGKIEKFMEDVNKLRQKFVNNKVDGYVFAKQKTEYNLPISDLPQLTQNSWNHIKSNKKLNLPSEKDQLANFRCSTIMAEVEVAFQKQLNDLNDNNLSTDFGALREKHLHNYFKETHHYGKKISEVKANQLIEGINDSIKKAVTSRLDNKSAELLKQFKEQSANFHPSTDHTLDSDLNKIFQVKVEQFITFMKKMNFEIPDRKDRIEEISKSMKATMKQIKENKLKENEDIFQKESSRETRLMTSELIQEKFGKEFWKDARNSISNKSHQLIQNYRKSYVWASGEELDPVEYGNMEEAIQSQAKQLIKTQLEKSLQTKIVEEFKKKFYNDKEGNEINFNLKQDEQITKHFDETRQDVMQTINMMNQFNIGSKRSSIIETDEDDFLFESTWLSNTTEQIQKQIIAEFEKTMRRKKQSQMNQVPWWLFLLIFFFVYDDIWFTEEDSPILHYTFVTVILVVVSLFAIGQGKVVKEGIRMVTDQLKEKFAFLR